MFAEHQVQVDHGLQVGLLVGATPFGLHLGFGEELVPLILESPLRQRHSHESQVLGVLGANVPLLFEAKAHYID